LECSAPQKAMLNTLTAKEQAEGLQDHGDRVACRNIKIR
jgi:hypothetical protein